MTAHHFCMKRRQFLQHSATALGCLSIPGFATAAEAEATPPLCSFFVIGDTHMLAVKNQPDLWDEASAHVTRGLIKAMNSLPGTAIPGEAGGGQVRKPEGVVHVGDIVDSGDKSGPVHEAMQRTEWRAYTQSWGLTGSEGLLQFPVMDMAGNHDGPRGTGYIMEQLAARHRSRKGLKSISENGLHYSWDWNGVHCAALGLIVGTDKSVTRKRRYGAMDSLDFLKQDLAANTAPGQPLLLFHHVDILRYAVEKPKAKIETWEWDPADVQAFHAAIKGRPAAIFYGHTHNRNAYLWDGGGVATKQGIPVFNVDNSCHFHGRNHAFFYVEVRPSAVLVREYATKDTWQSGFWTPQVWNTPFAV